jgi:dephospho-CoA kinase
LGVTLRIGLTGGIGSGKSTVARLLAERGAALIDADAIARSLTAPAGGAMPAVVAAFGAGVQRPDGSLDREAMRALVFQDANARQRLEAILHPLIGQETRHAAEKALHEQSPKALVFDVPLLTESRHWRKAVDRILVVDCEEATQVQRVVARSGWTPKAVQAVIASQASRAQRRAIADGVLHNEGLSFDELAASVEALWSAWGLTAAPRMPSA